jgi:hypothetical protein
MPRSDTQPSNRGLLLLLTAVVAVLTVTLALIAQPPGSALAWALGAAFLATAASVGISLSATSLRRQKDQPVQLTHAEETRVHGRWERAEAVKEQPVEPSRVQETQPQTEPEQSAAAALEDLRQAMQAARELAEPEPPNWMQRAWRKALRRTERQRPEGRQARRLLGLWRGHIARVEAERALTLEAEYRTELAESQRTMAEITERLQQATVRMTEEIAEAIKQANAAAQKLREETREQADAAGDPQQKPQRPEVGSGG